MHLNAAGTSMFAGEPSIHASLMCVAQQTTLAECPAALVAAALAQEQIDKLRKTVNKELAAKNKERRETTKDGQPSR
jgi:hypothetical protein